MADAPQLNLGHLIEGVVERDPMTDALQIRTIDDQDRQIFIKLEDLFSTYVGQEVRLTLSSMEALLKIQELLEESGGGVQAVMPEDLDGVARRVTRKPD